jgi:hypothetical protein
MKLQVNKCLSRAHFAAACNYCNDNEACRTTYEHSQSCSASSHQITFYSATLTLCLCKQHFIKRIETGSASCTSLMHFAVATWDPLMERLSIKTYNSIELLMPFTTILEYYTLQCVMLEHLFQHGITCSQ